MPSLFGPGISSWTTAQFAGTISWIYVLSAKLIKLPPLARSARLLGGYATMHFTFIASAVGSKPVKFAHWTTVSGNFRSTVTRTLVIQRRNLDMLCSFFSIIGDPSNGFFCYAQGYSTHFFCVASFLWTTTIAFTLHRTVVRHKTDVEDLEPMFHLYVWGTSLVMTVMRSIGNDHGRLGVWCLTQTGRAGKVIHFITFYAPLWGAILFNGFTYFQVIRMLNNARRMAVGIADHSRQYDAKADMKALNRWGYYPLILIGSWAFGTINRIHDFVEPGHKIFWLSFLDVGMAALMGLFNSIAYGLNSSVRRAIYERLDLWCPDKFRRCLPTCLKLRGQEAESELVSLKIQDQQ